MRNPLQQLSDHGQSPWFDYIRRSLFSTGELQRLIDGEGLKGMTSNPAIFQKAIADSNDYVEQLSTLSDASLDPMATYEAIAVADIQQAADLLRPVYEASERRDGYVSLEVSPHLANETSATIEEARRLWEAVGRDNLMIKVPATDAGLPAVEELIAGGICVNVTLIFAVATYRRVADAYLKGLERLVADGHDAAPVASVASFFVSRIDTAVDAALEQLRPGATAGQNAVIDRLLGKIAIANAKEAYAAYHEIFQGPRWQSLEARGAQTQRLLWASTGTKNPSYSDVLYVEELIGRDTVNTIPPATWQAFLDHGQVAPTLAQGLDQAREQLEDLANVGISLSEITDQLLEQGVTLFADAFDQLLSAVKGVSC